MNSKNNSLKPVLVCLQKVFTQLGSIITIWRESNIKAELHAKSIANLMEQLESCEKVKRRDVTEIEDITEVKQLLVQKIRATIEEDAQQLNLCLTDMENGLSQIDGMLGDTRQTLDSNPYIDFNDLTMVTSATRPSIFQMLVWLQDIERHLRQEHQSRRTFVDNLSSFSSKSACNMIKDWETHSLQNCIVSEIWPHLQFFLQENLN